MNQYISKQSSYAIGKRHRRQFVLTNAALRLAADWHSLDLGSGYTLYHCPQLRVRSVTDKSGVRWALLGHVFPVDESVLANLEALIQQTSSENIPLLTTTWAGRWLLVSNCSVIPDAACLLGAFTYETNNDLFITGSLSLLSDITQTTVRDFRTIGWYGFNWYPAPGSKLEGVRRLLPDQIYHPASRQTTFFDRLKLLGPLSPANAAALITAGLTHAFMAMHTDCAKNSIVLALTAGLDSRTNFAALRAADVPFSSITIRHSRISLADKYLPTQISARTGVKHSFIDNYTTNPDKLNEYDRHTLSTVNDGDRYFYARGSYSDLRATWLIRSGCWEIGRKYFHGKLAGLTLDEVADRPENLMRRFRTYFHTRSSAAALREWAHWRLKHQLEGIDWMDIFYRDQRLGSWLSSIEQSLDLIDPISIHPINSDYFYSLMLSVIQEPGEELGAVQYALIAQSAPDLADVPVNPRLDGALHRTMNMISKLRAVAVGEIANLMRI